MSFTKLRKYSKLKMSITLLDSLCNCEINEPRTSYSTNPVSIKSPDTWKHSKGIHTKV